LRGVERAEKPAGTDDRSDGDEEEARRADVAAHAVAAGRGAAARGPATGVCRRGGHEDETWKRLGRIRPARGRPSAYASLRSGRARGSRAPRSARSRASG